MSGTWVAALAPLIGLLGLCLLVMPGAGARRERMTGPAEGVLRSRRAGITESHRKLRPPAS